MLCRQGSLALIIGLLNNVVDGLAHLIHNLVHSLLGQRGISKHIFPCVLAFTLDVTVIFIPHSLLLRQVSQLAAKIRRAFQSFKIWSEFFDELTVHYHLLIHVFLSAFSWRHIHWVRLGLAVSLSLLGSLNCAA